MCGVAKEKLQESLHPLTHPPHVFVLAQFFKTCLFSGWSVQRLS